MRNLKRVLSLALASVMLLGMMVIGAGAADKTFADLTDSDKIANQEAVSLMVDLGIIEGKPDGSYDPSATVDRATMAKLITMLLMGDVDQSAFEGTKTDLTDIDNSWAEGYIKFCYSNGIITGDGQGHFFPEQPVTVVQAAKMLLVAVGYDAADRGYTNDPNWSVNIMRDAQSTTEWSRTENNGDVIYKTGSVRSLTKGLNVKATDPLTRDNAAQMIFNTLFVTNKKPVYAFDMGQQYISSYQDQSSLAATTYNGLYAVKGVLDTVDTANGTAKIGTASVKISAKTGDIGSTVVYYRDTNGLVSSAAVASVAEALATSTNGTAFTNLITRGKTGYLGLTLDENVSIYVNGNKQTTDTYAQGDIKAGDGLYVTGNDADLTALKTVGDNHDEIGSVIEFLDADNNGKVDTIKITEYTLSEITKTTAAKADGTEATISIKGVSGTIAQSLVSGDFANLAKDDVVMYAKIGTMYYVYEPTTVTGVMTAYNTSKHTMVVDGTTYYASGAKNDTSKTDAQDFTGNSESVFYLDSNGYVVAVDGVAAETKYAVVDAIAWVNGAGVNAKGYAEAKLIFTDGSTETVIVDKLGNDDTLTGVSDSNNGSYANGEISSKVEKNAELANCIYTYKTDSDGNYELTRVAEDNASTTINKGVATIGSLATANNDTVYVYKTTKDNKSTVATYTGYKNAPTATNATVAVATKGGYAKFVFVTASSDAVGDTTSDIIVFLSNEGVEYVNGSQVYLYKAALNGVVDTYKSKDNLNLSDSDYNKVFTIDVDSDGYISNKGDASGDYTYATATADASAGTVKTNATVNGVANATLTFDGSETVYVIGGKDVTVGSANDIVAGTYFWVKTVDKTTAAGKVAMKTVYVLAASDTNAAFPASITLGKTSGSGTASNTDVKAGTAAITGAAAGDKFTVTAAEVSNGYVTVTVKGAGTTATATGTAAAEYTLVAGDLGSSLTVTVTSAQAGKTPVTNVYTITVNQ